MTSSSLKVSNLSGQQLYYFVVDAGFVVQPVPSGSSNILQAGLNSITIPSTAQMRIYVSSSPSLFSSPGLEPIGWNTTIPFSFYEYTIDASGFSADMSYIDDWAYPIQTNIKDSAGSFHNFGFLMADEVAMTLAAMAPGSFVTSAASGQGVGTPSDLWDPVNRRFVGPMRLWQQQVIMANAVQNGQPAYWPPNPPAGWIRFLEDVPYGPSPFGYPASATASSLNPQTSYPAYGFDFSVNTGWSAMNGGQGAQVAQPRGEQLFADNWNVWNYGFTQADPSAAKPSPNYSFEANAYTTTLRAQAARENASGILPGTAGGSPSAGNPNFVGFYTASKDDYYGTFTVPDIANVMLTIGALAPSTIGSSGNDAIEGTAAGDLISGGHGADILSGAPFSASGLLPYSLRTMNFRTMGFLGVWEALLGGGSDTFAYLRADSSLPGVSSRDVIVDFGVSDRIDLSRVDADALAPGRQPFDWIGNGAFAGEAGQLRVTHDPSTASTFLQGDVDGNGQSDFEVMLLGLVFLTSSNLILS